jgi:hypothetical protein
VELEGKAMTTVDARERASRTQAMVIDALRDRGATPREVIARILDIDDREYTRDRIAGAMNTLLGRGLIEMRDGRIALVRGEDGR